MKDDTTTQDVRQQLWIAVAAAVASANDCKKIHLPGEWANRALADFDKAFPQQPKGNHE